MTGYEEPMNWGEESCPVRFSSCFEAQTKSVRGKSWNSAKTRPDEKPARGKLVP